MTSSGIQTRFHGIMAMLVCAASCLPTAFAWQTSESESSTTEAATTQPIRYTFRSPDYSLRDEPQRIAPQTLSQANPSPGEAIIFGQPIRWWSSHWSSQKNTLSAVVQQRPEFEKFIVTEPSRRKVWVKYFDIPIDPRKYPIVVMKYRAKNIDTTSGDYVLYLDDSSGPDYGGLLPFKSCDLVADGKEHVMTFDMRTLNPLCDLIGLAIGVHSDKKIPATFDLLDLRFEAAKDAENEVTLSDEKIAVKVTDQSGKPIKDATVTVDAERKNWANSSMTDADGVATVQPYSTRDARHMIRVTHPGMLPTELRNVGSSTEETVILYPAAIYRGSVVDEKGNPLPYATVNIFAAPEIDKKFWVRKDTQVLTDEKGQWQTPPMPAEAMNVRICVSHPDYAKYQHNFIMELNSTRQLQDGTLKLPIVPAPANKNDDSKQQRRRGYDPEKIFRSLS